MSSSGFESVLQYNNIIIIWIKMWKTQYGNSFEILFIFHGGYFAERKWVPHNRYCSMPSWNDHFLKKNLETYRCIVHWVMTEQNLDDWKCRKMDPIIVIGGIFKLLKMYHDKYVSVTAPNCSILIIFGRLVLFFILLATL